MGAVRVLHVIPTLDQSGAEKQLAFLAAHLPRDRFDVHVCAITRGGHYAEVLRAAEIPVTVLGKRFKFDPTTLVRLYRFIVRLRPDVVQTWLFAGNCYGRLAARWAKTPVIIASERCVDSWKRQYQLALDRYLSRWSDAVVANSHAVAAFYRGAGIPAAKLRVIGNAADPPLPRAAPAEIALRRSELGIDPGCPVIAVVGRLWPQKRVGDLVWALDVLRIAGWHAHLLVLGDGPRRAALERFTRQLELEPYVHFLGHRKDAEHLLDAADVVAIPSIFEGMPNAALEAMRRRLPVVACRIPGMDEVVVDGQTGLLVEPKRPFELARALARILADPALQRRLGEAGAERIQSRFDIGDMIAAYDSLYGELLAPTPALRESV